ncbi:MAG: hypothetical protein GXY33_11205 [Phycisphaerae bacterium]|nr:hypothetical protein [Phycisphaerae bacterium]
MEYAIVARGVLIDKETIRLEEPLPPGYKRVKVLIEAEDQPHEHARVFGSAGGEISIRPEFYEPLEEFREYMG